MDFIAREGRELEKKRALRAAQEQVEAAGSAEDEPSMAMVLHRDPAPDR